MLVIRQEQLEALIAANDNELEYLIAVALNDVDPLRTLNYRPELLRDKMIRNGIERARSHGLTKAEDLAAFVAVMFEVAPNFDEQQELNAILNDTTFPLSERFYQLFERASDDAWLEAEKNYDYSAWLTPTSK